MRLAKYLAHAGVASRRAAEKLIAAGSVSVDGEVVLDPARDVTDEHRVRVEGRELSGAERRVTYALHKPAGIVSTARDTHGRRTVLDLVAEPQARLYPVGRLDADSSGLILLTNDGELANRLTHPSFEVHKTYRVTLGGAPIGDAALRRLRDGVRLEDGLTAPARARRLGEHELELTIHEGRNRQIRRMCAAVGHPVLALVRVRFGPLELDDLREGEHRLLSEHELGLLRAL
ncbi:MAG TPA: pseudouridine synthase [Solirubrobacteraceae bacterium]|jgi:23S rRNA pseudouridine2605 synthase|nr:pseudouridine synthase [Solirubrobacteraceae bacterium]